MTLPEDFQVPAWGTSLRVSTTFMVSLTARHADPPP